MEAHRVLNVQSHKIVVASFNEEKSGIPIFFIHGITASINFWEPIQTPAFQERFRWYSFGVSKK